MAATISVPAASYSSKAVRFIPFILEFLVAVVMAALAQQAYVAPALAVLLVAEVAPLIWGKRLHVRELLARATPFIVGASVIVVIALLPKAVSQLALAAAYGGWRVWRAWRPAAAPMRFVELLTIQAVLFEALFLAADIWHLARPLTLMLVWVGVYTLMYQPLAARGERTAGVLAAAWALVATEASWVFLTWMVSYVSIGHFIVMPQATLVLTTLAYCFGNIFLAQKAGTLNRARFTEYLLIGLILIWIVIAGTHWRGSI